MQAADNCSGYLCKESATGAFKWSYLPLGGACLSISASSKYKSGLLKFACIMLGSESASRAAVNITIKTMFQNANGMLGKLEAPLSLYQL